MFSSQTLAERDKDRFKVEAFDFLAKFFENSSAELEKRNPGIERDFRRIDANRFTAAIYRDGKALSRCTIYMGGGNGFMGGIAFSHGETSASNSYNEMLRVEADDQSLHLTAMGMAYRGGGRDEKLSHEGAVEAYWGIFMQPLQIER